MQLAKIIAETRERAEIDSAMLKSMAASFRSGLGFSFNPVDMAELLDRLREDHIDHLT